DLCPDARGPRALVPFGARAHRVPPRIGRIVEGTGVDRRPIQKIPARIVRVLIAVEDTAHAEFAYIEPPPVDTSIAAQLIGLRVDRFPVAGEIHGVADEQSGE